MTRFEVMLEGESDVPVIREVFTRRFAMIENQDFKLHPHKGKGTLQLDPNHRPQLTQRGLLDQLPAKLRGMSHYAADTCILILLDVDNEDCKTLLTNLKTTLYQLPKRPPNVEFRLAIEEIESWLIADQAAIKTAYPRAKLNILRPIAPDQCVGAWETLARSLGLHPKTTTGADKFEWATKIAPHLKLVNAPSPSFRRFIDAVERIRGVTGSRST
jgi:hypothetical protein